MRTSENSGQDYPAIPDGKLIDVDGIRTFYIDKGQGKTIVLMHGSSIAIDGYLTWFRTINTLSEHFRVIAFDQIGFGRTDMPADGRYRDRLERCGHAIAFLEQLGIANATLIGHSEGGFLTTYIALNRPEFVDRLVVVTSGGTTPLLGGSLDDAWIEASNSAYDYPDQAIDEERFVATNSYLEQRADPPFEAVLRENYRLAQSSGQAIMMVNLRKNETDPRLYVRLQETHLLPRISSLTVPILLIWAANDATVPVARATKLMELAPHADLHVFSNAGHMVMHDRASDFCKLIRNWCQ